MNKTTKGSLAAGAAAVLLLGGAGSLAFWTDAAIVNGGEINSGFLTLDAVEFAPGQDCTDIVYAEANLQNVSPVEDVVPGDVVTTTCTFAIRAEGDNLEASPFVPDTLALPSTPSAAEGNIAGGAGQLFANVSVDYQVGQTGALEDFTVNDLITEANDTDLLVAKITIEIPYGTGDFLPNGDVNPVAGGPEDNRNNTQNITAALDDLTVTLTQDDPNP